MSSVRPAAYVLAALTVSFSLSGCVASEGASPEGTGAAPTVADAPDPQFTDDTGAIVGLVTDDQINPIPGTQIGLIDLPEFSAFTDAAGAFTLSNVPPGSHQLAAQALGYESVGRNVEVVAGAATTVNLILTSIPLPVARHFTYIFSGFIPCAAAIVRTTYVVGCPSQGGSTASTQDIGDYDKKGGWPVDFAALLFEADWNTQDFLAFDLVDRSIGYFGVYFRIRDNSPVRYYMERCGTYVGAPNFGRAPMPCTDEQVNASQMHMETFYVGQYQDQTHTLDPVCRENITVPVTNTNVYPGYQAGCYGAGVALDLKFTNYATVFYVEKPTPKDLETISGRPG